MVGADAMGLDAPFGPLTDLLRTRRAVRLAQVWDVPPLDASAGPDPHMEREGIGRSPAPGILLRHSLYLHHHQPALQPTQVRRIPPVVPRQVDAAEVGATDVEPGLKAIQSPCCEGCWCRPPGGYTLSRSGRASHRPQTPRRRP